MGMDKEGYIWTSRRREHRLIWEKYHNAKLLPYTDIHHINGNKQDNRIENLLPLYHNQHLTLHKTGSKHSEETKLKISVSKTGKHINVGNNNPMFGRKGKSNPNYGRKLTEEHKRKIGLKSIGRHQSGRKRKNLPSMEH